MKLRLVHDHESAQASRDESPSLTAVADHVRTDAERMADVARGDLTALGEVYRLYAADMFRSLRRVLGPGSSADIEDVVHTTFLKLPSIAGGFDGRASCRAWLSGIAIRIGLRQRRSVHRALAALGTLTGMSARTTETDPESEAGGRQEMRAFERAFARLGPKKRAVLLLIESDGLTHDQVAQVLEIPVATVRTRLFTARNELREAMRKEGFE
jgi:RNA polymerase sigma-70 factor (ECF subfamily)